MSLAIPKDETYSGLNYFNNTSVGSTTLTTIGSGGEEIFIAKFKANCGKETNAIELRSAHSTIYAYPNPSSNLIFTHA